MDGNDHMPAWMRRLNAKLDRVLLVLEDHAGRLQRVEGSLFSLSARFAGIATFHREVTRICPKLDKQSRTLTTLGRTASRTI